ncbi:MAG: sulfite exporter TauE/SafE family protein [Micropepsaceae bacterium]
MELSFEFWYLLPISILIATIAMSSGIGGAVFFTPIFLLWLKLEPTTAVATSIFIVVVTVSVAVTGHMLDFAADANGEIYQQVLNITAFTVPGVLIGGQIGPRLQAHLDPDALKVAIAVVFVLIGLFMLWTLIP